MAWIPDDREKFRKIYMSGASDFDMAVAFDTTPDRVGKYISSAVSAGVFTRRGAFIPIPFINDEVQRAQKANLPKAYVGNPDNILVIGDTHFPFEKKGYLEFCRSTQERFDCGTIVHIGDEADNCAMSYHESDPDGYGASTEADLAQESFNNWYQVFPDVNVIIGNHSALHFRKSFTSGIPRRFLKDYEQVWNAPEGWKWTLDKQIHGVYFTHGTGCSGERSAYVKALNMRMPVVQGHVHTVGGVLFNGSGEKALWGMQVGCGIDEDSYAVAYARVNAVRFVLSCGVILDKGKVPFVVPM